MSNFQTLFALLLAAAASNGSACAMTTTPDHPIRCAVNGGDKLPPEVGGEQAVCATIQAAVLPVLKRAKVPAKAVAVSVEVKSDSKISALPSVNGKPLTERHVASSDSALTRGAVDMLANAVAAELSRATRQPIRD